MSDAQIQKYLQAINTNYYRTLSEDELTDIQNKVDNFLEIAYLAPHQLSTETLNLLSARETKLKTVKLGYQILGALVFSVPYYFHRQKMGFYFRNFCWTIVGSLVFSNLFGNYGLYFYNRKHYKHMIMKLALNYNISDDEVEALHEKIKLEGLLSKISDSYKLKLKI